MLRVTIYNEYIHERNDALVNSIYNDGIHMCIKRFLEDENTSVSTIVLDDVKGGLTDAIEQLIDSTDVMLWWGHLSHGDVPDEVAQYVHAAVLRGMGMIFLHSGHHSKPFRLLMGTPCNLTWREDGDYERVWVVNPAHPIAQGVGRYIYLEHEETYGEPFDVPEPDETVFIGGYEYGEVFRSGICYRRGRGRIFYFQPGHETFPTYKNKDVQTVIKNAVRWAAPVNKTSALTCPNVKKPGTDGQ